VVFVYATLFLSLGLIHLRFDRRWWDGQRVRLAIGIPLIAAFVYVKMPPLVFPQAFAYLLYPLVPSAAYGLADAARTAVRARRIVSLRRAPVWPYLGAVSALAAFAGVLALAPYVDAGGLRDVAHATTATSAAPSADLARLRVVPQESAEFTGNKIVGQFGTYYRVGSYNVQLSGGRLVWIAPLEYDGPLQWLSRRTTPGVVLVDAENPDAQPELRRRAPLRYVPSALLNENLLRHVYLRFGTERILEATVQLDETGAPQYVVPLGRPTIGWSGTVVTAVVLVDPATGAMRRIPRSAFASLPSWVGRVQPAALALEYTRWFGAWVHGLLNYYFLRHDVHVPARNEVFGLSAGGRFVWFVDHTSPLSDQSMTGFTYMDAISGAITYYTASSGEFNSRGAEDAVASNPVVRQGKLFPTQPLLYNLLGQNTWIVPLVAETGKYQTLALVQAKNGHAIVGSSSSPSPQNDALAQYATFLGMAPPSSARPSGVGSVGGGPARAEAGTIDRVAVTSDALYFTLRGRRGVFRADLHGDASLALARAGDRVEMSVDAVAEAIAHVRKLVDRSLVP